ncbi:MULTISPECIES: 2-amino-4-hydroxy-6-hydroxymethyldihydropteridine diphosphokinase [unclassified Carboxylicivirga]|uniref:2-amino-4-hydroxy-6- hydroxymethyldihydropteridine diphosphokinase n=1 Tax=Carboxylicivirga TaxID=1628153 RepID=UPI003D342EAB
MNTIILLLGGNEGDVIASIKEAVQLLAERLGKPLASSHYYESEPWGFKASQNFINQVVAFHSHVDAIEILNFTQMIEKRLGRKTKTGTHYASRPIDIDILFIDDQHIQLPRLTVPHPRLHERMFTLLPLTEHWKKWRHPVLNKTVQELLIACDDKGLVRRLD